MILKSIPNHNIVILAQGLHARICIYKCSVNPTRHQIICKALVVSCRRFLWGVGGSGVGGGVSDTVMYNIFKARRVCSGAEYSHKRTLDTELTFYH